MNYNLQVVSQSNFEEACDQIIIAIGNLKRSLRPQEPAAPAEAPAPTKKAKASKAAATPTPEPKPEPEHTPAADAYSQVLKAVVDFATAHGKAAATAKLNSMGFARVRDIPPQSYEAITAAFQE